jgi:cell division protein FtsL
VERYNGYVYGSVAPKLPESTERQVGEQRIGKKVSKQTRSYQQTSSMPKARMVFALLFITAVCFVILYRFSVITELNSTMGELTAQYNLLRDENRKLKVDIETSIDLDYVRQIAETKLNMHKPDQYQLVLVSVPKSNYSVVLNYDYIDETTQKTSLVDKIMKTVRAVLP